MYVLLGALYAVVLWVGVFWNTDDTDTTDTAEEKDKTNVFNTLNCLKMELIKYNEGQTLTYKPANTLCKVVHNTLQPGGVNADEAIVFVTYRNSLQAVPVAKQDKFLTTDPPVKVGKRPLPKQ